ncbi:MAG TPA: Asp-tRNA(Asn)/Glu-tRNA(Gln) amidotransferase subunit GatB [Candidatus Paceibacterota bacterium]|nr:Asp-tRNA(Asn)/Glu-tRNA(Gln) amidotransferase subunit GatB [Candidatus Paceibacterota bacterium]
MSDYRATIGLEIHAELNTQAKMFCACKNDPDEERPNTNICPVCTAQPGTLPVVNLQAVEHVLRVGKAVGAQLADFTEWDRKNYFYPDIPKGYQITQYKYPLVSGGSLAGVALTRIHLEEDTGSSRHDMGDFSVVDYNRAGVPLMELVTEPVIHDAETAMRFGKELQLLLRTLGASEANMDKGQMRVEVNISISKTDAFGTKVEVKNINSFSAAGAAIVYEMARQEAAIEAGEKIIQETRGWDENTGKTFSQRKKESANDYRYFPDPDIPKLVCTEVFGKEYEKLTPLPELPWQKRERILALGIDAKVTEIYVSDEMLGTLFDEVTKTLGDDVASIRLASNYISSDLVSLLKSEPALPLKVNAKTFIDLAGMINANELSSRGAKDTLLIIYREGGDVREIAEKNGLIQKSDLGELERIAGEIIAANPVQVAEFKAGKASVLMFFVGQGMKAMKGAGNPKLLGEVFTKLLA